MVELNKIVEFLDDFLLIKNFKNDVSNNGLQVESNSYVKKVGFAVDASIQTFLDAIDLDCDLLITHHGISWGNSLKTLTGNTAKKIQLLFGNNLSLYAAHLPLDANPKIGNNIALCELLEISKPEPFAEYAGYEIGFYGKLKKQEKLKNLIAKIEKKLQTKCQIIGNKDLEKMVKTIGIVSGGGADEISDAQKLNLDVFLTGEFSHQHAILAEEISQTLIAAGHYATEVFGVKNLMPILQEKFKIETVFIDNPTGF